MLAFYPGGTFKPVCNSQFCDYRDHYDQFQEFNLGIIGISSDPLKNQQEFARYNCKRALFIINTKGIILYRYVEPTFLSKRGSAELVGVLRDLQNNGLI